jgi:hypothetical protein
LKNSFGTSGIVTGVNESQAKAMAAFLMKLRGNSSDESKIDEYKTELQESSDALTQDILNALELIK